MGSYQSNLDSSQIQILLSEPPLGIILVIVGLCTPLLGLVVHLHVTNVLGCFVEHPAYINSIMSKAEKGVTEVFISTAHCSPP